MDERQDDLRASYDAAVDKADERVQATEQSTVSIKNNNPDVSPDVATPKTSDTPAIADEPFDTVKKADETTNRVSDLSLDDDWDRRTENPPPRKSDISLDDDQNRRVENPPPRKSDLSLDDDWDRRTENPPPRKSDISLDDDQNRRVENPPPGNPQPPVANPGNNVQNVQEPQAAEDNIQLADAPGERPQNAVPPQQAGDVIRGGQIGRQQRMSRRELFLHRQEELVRSSGVPIAAIQGRNGPTYITQSDEGKFYAVLQGPRGIRRVEMNKSFRPENLWQNPRAIINPNVALDPATGRFKAIQQEQQPEAGQQVAQPPAQAGGNIWNPGVWNREQFNNIPQPGGNIWNPGVWNREQFNNIPQPGGGARDANVNRAMLVKLQPGTRFRFYEDTMTLVVE